MVPMPIAGPAEDLPAEGDELAVQPVRSGNQRHPCGRDGARQDRTGTSYLMGGGGVHFIFVCIFILKTYGRAAYSSCERPEAKSKEKLWDPMPELTYPHLMSSPDPSNTFTMSNPMPESTLTHARVDFIPQSGTSDFSNRLGE